MKILAFLLALPLCAATLPTTLLNPTVPIVTGATRTVCASMCDFTTIQAAWNAASPGDEIVITAGQTFTSAGTLLTLSNKAGNNSILIRSSASGSLTTGVRVGSANAANMPKLTVSGNNISVIQNDFTNGTVSLRAAHNVYFLGLNITLDPSVIQNFGVVTLSPGDDVSGAPSSITFDRCWIHSDHNATGAQDFVRGFSISGSRLALINSTVEGFSSPNIGADSQGVLVFGGPGIGLLRNNFLDAATENVMFGGTNGGLQTNQVTDWEISFNFFKKASAWNVSGTNAKNCFEFKTGIRMWAHDNLFENCFTNTSQTGACVLFTNRPSQSGYGNTTTDVTFEGNVCRHIGQSVQILGNDNFCGQMTSTVNTAGAAITITGGTQGDTGWFNLPVTIAGVPFTVSSFSSPTAGTLATSAGTQTGAALQTVYSQCKTQARITSQNNLFEDIDNTFNGGNSVAYAYLLYENTTLFAHNTLLPGAVMPINQGIYGGAPVTGCVTPVAGYMTSVSITSNIILAPTFGMFADCFTTPSFFVPPQVVSGTLTNNLAAAIPAPEQTQWNTVGSSNQFPASYAAIGLLSDNKALSPMSTYFATGAGANLETCFAETAIRNGTVAGTSCSTVPLSSSTVISGQVTISGRTAIQ